jgi:hypothetical protein
MWAGSPAARVKITPRATYTWGLNGTEGLHNEIFSPARGGRPAAVNFEGFGATMWWNSGEGRTWNTVT